MIKPGSVPQPATTHLQHPPRQSHQLPGVLSQIADNGRYLRRTTRQIGQRGPATTFGNTRSSDRVNLGGSAAYYVSFDNEEVGKLQGQTLADCLSAGGVSTPSVLAMNGGTDVDNNAVLFAKGANSVLMPLQQQGKLKIASESVVKGWKTANAAPTFTQALTAAGGQADGVLAANDDIANAVIGVLQQNGAAGHVFVTGQDGQVEGLQNILKGQQSMTIFKNVMYETNAAAKLAIALIGGQDPSSMGVTFSDQQLDPKNSSLKSVLLPAQVITYSNVQDVVTAGALKASEICNGLQQQCDAAGVK